MPSYIYALRYRWLNALYDPVLRLMGEARLRQRLLDAVPDETTSMLDLACGTGTFTRLAKKQRPELGITGVDGDADMIRRAGEAATDIRYDVSLAQSLPYEDASFDVVTSTLFFHHIVLHDKRLALAEVKRILRPGGTLLIADWGKPDNVLMRAVFYLVQLFDGSDSTGDNVRGLLPVLVKEVGFADVSEFGVQNTILGTIRYLRARS